MLRALRGTSFDCVATVAACVDGRLVGVATLERVLAAADGAVLADVMDPQPPMVTRSTDPEQAVWRASRHGQSGLAVVDQHRLVTRFHISACDVRASASMADHGRRSR